MADIARLVHVNIPFPMLRETYLDTFIRLRLNPEIYLDAVSLDTVSPSEFKRIAAALAENGLAVTFHAPFQDLSAGSIDPEIRRVTRHRMAQVAELVPVFSPRSVVAHAGYDARYHYFFRDEWVEYGLTEWAGINRELRDAGTRLMLENVFEDGPADIEILFETLGEAGVGFCLDTGHLTAFSRTDMAGWLSGLGDAIGQLHIHDNHGQHDDHLAPGLGIVDFGTLFDYLAGHRPTPPIITIEPHREQDLAPALEYLSRVWPW